MTRQLLLKKVGQQYAKIEEVLGQGHFQVRTLNKGGKQSHMVAIARGPTLEHHLQLVEGTTVLLSLSNSDSGANLVHAYTSEEVRKLKEKGEIS
ncbi:hypothetical protein F5B20DRAFT_565687 [Whalleya microplaca]|nr:hypothetical protein F5B20DRAFT_565687 [Whalleya microplaca]